MGDTVMPLTDTAIRNAKAKDKPYKLSDEKGLYLLINKAGKYFRFDYRYAGKRKTMAFGAYPDVKLVDAKKSVMMLAGCCKTMLILPSKKRNQSYTKGICRKQF